ncbi:hypothetical protein EYF80_051798 [Liparis tanakae]|uniref:Uncharacterized protein n=1 Tax=Liparis tanakae TaxID=230148 RepID=A0A4Z2FAW8_9TELE|nr:hypothetical protein EYF80_051798 [Liparis tanakae]
MRRRLLPPDPVTRGDLESVRAAEALAVLGCLVFRRQRNVPNNGSLVWCQNHKQCSKNHLRVVDVERGNENISSS